MAKDPAFLFYPGDWQGGTQTLSRFLKGCFLDLLVAQFNSGPLSLEEIKTVLGSDFGQSWPSLQKKFKQADTGLFYNERLELEKEKRRAYSDSRSKNRSKKTYVPTYDTSYVKHMSQHMENENRIETGIERDKGGVGEKGEPLFFIAGIPQYLNPSVWISRNRGISNDRIRSQYRFTPEQWNSILDQFDTKALQEKFESEQHVSNSFKVLCKDTHNELIKSKNGTKINSRPNPTDRFNVGEPKGKTPLGQKLG